MGEAKRRGTLEERVVQAKVAEADRMLKRAQALAAQQEQRRRWEEANPIAAARQAKARRQLRTVLAVAAGITINGRTL